MGGRYELKVANRASLQSGVVRRIRGPVFQNNRGEAYSMTTRTCYLLLFCVGFPGSMVPALRVKATPLQPANPSHRQSSHQDSRSQTVTVLDAATRAAGLQL